MKKISRADLSQLEPDDLIEIIQSTEALIQGKKHVVEYTPNIVQERVHKSTAFIRALFSGNGVGKTTACINEAIWTSTGTHPHRNTARLPNTVIIVLDDSSKADTVYMVELRKRHWYDVSKLKTLKHGRAHTQEVIFPNGSNWIFMTHDMDTEKWESIQCAAVIFDEPPPRFIYIALLRGMREKDMKPWMMFAGTPLGRYAPWMHNEIFKPWRDGKDEEIECFFGSTDDNLHNLDPETIKRWEKRYSPQEMKTRRFGSFEFLAGRIFDMFNPDVHCMADFNWPKSWPCVLAIDPHLRKNHCAVILGVDSDKDIYVIRELETSLAGRKAAEFFINACEGIPICLGVCDNFGSIKLYDDIGDERKSFIEIFNETALRMNRPKLQIRPTTKAEKADKEWIEDMRDYLRLEINNEGVLTPRFHVFNSCQKTIDNFMEYVWDEHAGAKAADPRNVKEEPLGSSQDFLMCVKYGLAAKPDKIGMAQVYSRKQIMGQAQEYESYEKNWYKD